MEDYLAKLQDMIRETHAKIAMDCKFDKYQEVIRRQGLANRLRKSWKVIEGGLKDESPRLSSYIKKG